MNGDAGGDFDPPAGNPLQLVLAIGAFVTSFSLAATLGAMMPTLRDELRLTQAQVGLALAMPMLMGALARIPIGMLADRFGGKRVFLGVMSCSILPASLMPLVHNYWQLLVLGFLSGLPLGVFSIGVAFVSSWYPSHRQGTALGVLGFGYMGNSLALFGAPLVVGALGYAWGFWVFAMLVAAWVLVIALLARDAPRAPNRKRRTLLDYLRPLGDKRSWALSYFYFVTFGGTLAMTAYLPNFLTINFGLSRPDAGVRAGVFVVLAVCMRPAGGFLSDWIGPRRVLLAIFPIVAIGAMLMMTPSIVIFSIGALLMAIAIGLGNGAVFTLVPYFFPAGVGTVTGLVGAAGALGGFFPPLALGLIRQYTGGFGLGFALLAMFAMGCLVTCVGMIATTRAEAQNA